MSKIGLSAKLERENWWKFTSCAPAQLYPVLCHKMIGKHQTRYQRRIFHNLTMESIQLMPFFYLVGQNQPVVTDPMTCHSQSIITQWTLPEPWVGQISQAAPIPSPQPAEEPSQQQSMILSLSCLGREHCPENTASKQYFLSASENYQQSRNNAL